MHTALRPGGQLLDLHPDAVHSPVEVDAGSTIVPLGHLDDTLHIRDVDAALAARQVVIDAGQFVLEREIRFTFITHFDSVESWLRFLAEHAQKSVIPAELAARARVLLPPGSSGEVRIRRQTYAARLRRPGA